LKKYLKLIITFIAFLNATEAFCSSSSRRNKTYTVRVELGSGSGKYKKNEEVHLEANKPKDGLVFDKWVGDTQYIDSANESHTHFNMPTKNLVFTALFKKAEQIIEPKDNKFEKISLASKISQPMGIEVSENNFVFYIERSGKVFVYDLKNNDNNEVLNLNVTTENEYGLLGLALDPDFVQSGIFYLYYAPLNKKVFRLSSFTFNQNFVEKSSEKIILEIPVAREKCCHSGGALEFGNNGELFISTGDDTSPFSSNGYSPIDERQDKSFEDAQRTSANTNSLLGKILRIIPQPFAVNKYLIPSGNLFPPGTPNTKAEIYVMGARNPFRMKYDQDSSTLYWSDIGPDAAKDSRRGPMGYDEINRTSSPGNYGWPYLVANNLAYSDYDFFDNLIGQKFNPNNLVNDSPNNTGLRNLPMAKEAYIYYPYGESIIFPELGNNNGRSAMVGAVIRANQVTSPSAKSLPRELNDKLVIYDWVQNWIKLVDLKENIISIESKFSELNIKHPIDMHFAHDGKLYLLEWGDNLGSSASNSGKLSIINLLSGEQSKPIAEINVDKDSGLKPLTINFDASKSIDPLNQPLSFEWDVNDDGIVDSQQQNFNFTFNQNGKFNAKLTVISSDGKRTAIDTKSIVVGNARPIIDFSFPQDGSFFSWGDNIPYQVNITDPDGSFVAQNEVIIQPALGHSQHSHPLNSISGSVGQVPTFIQGHSEEADIYYVLEARYSDRSMNGQDPLTASKAINLNPSRLQAEYFINNFGIQLENIIDGGTSAAYINNGDWIEHRVINLSGISKVKVRVSSDQVGGIIQLRLGSVNGPIFGQVEIPSFGGWQNWQIIEQPITNIPGSQKLFIEFVHPRNNPTNNFLFNLDWIEFLP